MAEALQNLEEAELSHDAESAEVDGALLELEQALHRREALIVVTSHRGRQHSSLVRTALARFDEAYVVVLISPANAEPILALDRLLETAGHEIGNATGEEKQAALGGLIDRAGELGRPVIVVVDDAHLATVAQLEKLRTALNIDPGARRPVQLVLAGTQKLVRNLKSREARGLWTRVTAHIDIPEDAAATDGDAAPVTESGREQPTARRWPLLTMVSAGALVVALLVVATLARNFGSGSAANTGPVTAIEPARPAQTAAQSKPSQPSSPSGAANTTAPSIAPSATSPAAQPSDDGAQQPVASAQPSIANTQANPPVSSPPAIANTATPPGAQPSGASSPQPSAAAQTSGTPAGTPPTVVAGSPPSQRGAVMVVPSSGAGIPSAAAPSLAVAGVTALPGATNGQAQARAQSGPRVTEWMGVEQIHGSARRQPPADTAAAAPAAASAPAPSGAQPSAAAAATATPAGTPPAAVGDHAAATPTPTPVGPQLKRGAQIVEVETPQAEPGSPATIARAAVAADMAKASQASDDASKKSEALQADAEKQPAEPASAESTPAATPQARTAMARGASGYEIQLGAFRTMANAAKVRDAVIADFPATRIDEITVSGAAFYRVRVGPFPSAEETSRAEEQLRTRGFTPVRFNSSIKEG